MASWKNLSALELNSMNLEKYKGLCALYKGLRKNHKTKYRKNKLITILFTGVVLL